MQFGCIDHWKRTNPSVLIFFNPSLHYFWISCEQLAETADVSSKLPLLSPGVCEEMVDKMTKEHQTVHSVAKQRLFWSAFKMASCHMSQSSGTFNGISTRYDKTSSLNLTIWVQRTKRDWSHNEYKVIVSTIYFLLYLDESEASLFLFRSVSYAERWCWDWTTAWLGLRYVYSMLHT